MNSIITLFSTLFNLLLETAIFDIPVLIWLILPAVIAIVIKFIQGKK